MDYANAFIKASKDFYNAINPSTLSGAIDVIVVEQPDGEYKSTPFHIRFGKVGVWSPYDKYVDIAINGELVDLKMKLGDTGVAYPSLSPTKNSENNVVQMKQVIATTSTEKSREEVKTVEGADGACYYHSLKLTSETLKELGLKYGTNEARFCITTMCQGTSWCTSNIYLFKWYEQIVISDIDGTITKSDVLGHVIPAIGGQWAHSGVVELFTNIINNGYKMVYLSSRPIGQSHMTKQYLKTVVQESKRLPDGPVLLSPSSVLAALRLEMIERKPDEFKIAVLRDVKKLFPVEQPFYAGFGNRETDVKSYRAVGIPNARILVVDPSGHVRRSDSVGYTSSYKLMAVDTVDYLFPPLAETTRYITRKDSVTLRTCERSPWHDPLEHSAFMHWKPDDSEEIDVEIEAYEKKRKDKREKK